MPRTKMARRSLILITRPRRVSPVGTRGVKPKSVPPEPGTQMSCTELPPGADAPEGRVHDWQTNRPLSTMRYARGLPGVVVAVVAALAGLE